MAKTFERECGVVIERNCRKILRINPCFLEAIVDCLMRKPAVVFYSGKTFFLGCGDNFTVPDQRSGRVVIEARNAQDIDATLWTRARIWLCGSASSFRGNRNGDELPLANELGHVLCHIGIRHGCKVAAVEESQLL